MDIIKKFLKLPSLIKYEGVTFELQLFNNGTHDARLIYRIYTYENSSKHKLTIETGNYWHNPFYDNSKKTFAYLYQNISDSKSLDEAITDCKKFLKENNLWKKA